MISNLSQTAAAIRQRKRRAAESLNERETHLTNNCENKRIKRSLEILNQRKARLNRNRTQKQHERQRRVLENADERLNHQDDERHTDIIQPLSESDRSIDDLLSQVRASENRLHHVDYKSHDADHLDSETDDTIIRNFIPVPFLLRSENHVINDAFARMQSETGLMWPNIDDIAINEFNTPEYIARAFPTLYPTGSADL
ncbi:unnamed protein product [Rhizophagus irregularis]|nr:unnamed protein product [Rhizophagus irregularis]